MVRTYGLTHINLVVRDVERSLWFYGQVFGVEEYGRTEGLVHTRTPGCQDVITFLTSIRRAPANHEVSHTSASGLFHPGTSTRLSRKSSTPVAGCFGGGRFFLAAPTPTSTTRMGTRSSICISVAAALRLSILTIA